MYSEVVRLLRRTRRLSTDTRVHRYTVGKQSGCAATGIERGGPGALPPRTNTTWSAIGAPVDLRAAP